MKSTPDCCSTTGVDLHFTAFQTERTVRINGGPRKEKEDDRIQSEAVWVRNEVRSLMVKSRLLLMQHNKHKIN